jgi:ENTS family enterobactin (siderophore) exporter
LLFAMTGLRQVTLHKPEPQNEPQPTSEK